MPADELQVKLTAKDDLSAKVKAARAEFTRLGKEVAAANREMQATGRGQANYDRLRGQWVAQGRQLEQLRSQARRAQRDITAAATGPQSAWARGGAALTRYHATLQKVGAASALVSSLMGKKAVDATKTLVSQALATQRVLGGTVQDASRWNNAAALSGVTADQFATSIRFLGKNLEAASRSEKRAGDLVAQLGFDFRDAHGDVKPLGDLLPQLADRFAELPNGAEKTALAVRLFGRSGMAMVPMLSRGSSELDRFRAKAEELGVVVGPDMVASFKQYTTAQREYQRALLGFQVAVGTLLLPVVAGFMSALQGVAQWMTHLPGPVRAVVVVMGALTSAFLLAAPTVSRFMMAISMRGGWAAATAGARGFMATLVGGGRLAALGKTAGVLAGIGLAVAGLSQVGPNRGGPTGIDLLVAQLRAGGKEIGWFGQAADDGAGKLGAMLDSLASPAQMERFGNAADWVADALAGLFGGEGFTNNQERTVQEIQAIDQALVQLARTDGFPAAYAAFKRLTVAQKLNGQQTSDLKGELGGFREAWKTYTLGADKAAGATDAQAAAMEAAAWPAKQLAWQARAVGAAFESLSGQLDARRARLGFKSAMLAWREWLAQQKGGAKALLGGSKTAVEGQQQVLDLVDAAVRSADSYTGAAAKAAVLRANLDALTTTLSGMPAAARADLLKPLTDALAALDYQAAQTPTVTIGVAGAADAQATVEDLMHHYGLLDRTVAQPVVSAKTQTAQQQITAVQKKLAAADRQTATVTVTADTTDARAKIAAVRALLRSLSSAAAAISGALHLAGGGPVVGPGTGTSDSVPARLSAGEFVHRAAAASTLGLPAMWSINHADAWSGDRVRAVVAAATGRPGDVVVPGWAAPPAVPARSPSSPAQAPAGEVHVHVHGPFAAELDVAAAARRAARAAVAEIDAERRRRGTR